MMKLVSKVAGRRKCVGTVVFTQKPVAGPWGGSNQFVKQMEALLRNRGFDVRYDLRKKADVIVVVDPRKGPNKPLGHEEVSQYKKENPGVRVLHRVNECDLRKATDFMDPLLCSANACADYTVFISKWLRDYHAERWFDTSKPHSVIYNGADPAVFHPRVRQGGVRDTIRLVTHHWAPAYCKGYDIYAQIDEMIADKELEGVMLRVIGRWPDDLKWRSAEALGPLHGHALAEKLRESDVYINASRWEPCGMSQVEGIQCGLPLLYHRDGGGVTDVGRECGVEFTDDLKAAIEEMRRNFDTYHDRALSLDLGGDRMCMEFARLVRVLHFGRQDAPTDVRCAAE